MSALETAVLEALPLLVGALSSEAVENDEEKILAIVDKAVAFLGPDIVKARIDAYAAAKLATDAEFIARFGEKP